MKLVRCAVPGCDRTLPYSEHGDRNDYTDWNLCDCDQWCYRLEWDERGNLAHNYFKKVLSPPCPHPDCRANLKIAIDFEGESRCHCHGCKFNVQWQGQQLIVELRS